MDRDLGARLMEPRVALALSRLPHAPPMRAVVDLRDADGESSSWTVVVGDDHPLLVDGQFPAVCAVELVAQAAAAHAALDGASGRGGVLLRVRGVELLCEDIPVGVPLVATVRRTDGTDGATASFQTRLRRGDEVLMSGSLLVRMFDAG